MNKTIKKLLSAIIAASMLSASLSATAGAASMTYADGKLTYESDKAQTAVLLKAEYNDGTLEGVTVVNNAVELTEGTNTIDVTAEEGDKLFLWDSLSNVSPLADALAIAAGEETPDPTPDEGDSTPSPTPDCNTPPPGLPTWKFDFGSAEDVAEGFTAVTADKNYMTNEDYGFLGIDENGYKLSGRIDAFGMQEGQVIQLATGGTTGLNDGIGSTGEDLYGNAGDKYYPTRFALKVEDEQYFKVKATVTTLDPTKDAEASLYTERKHPIFTEKTIAAGESYTAEFTIRTTPIYYQKSEPQGAIADGMVNVAVLGENTALAALEIEQLETAPVMWVLGDSTVTDGNCTLPYFYGPNYTGVGTGLTKYLPSTIAMVNEGEGGLNAADSLHYNMVSSRIKAGDYLYLEYGHNHKDDGTAGYLANLEKYYTTCHNAGANLIIVSPIERINTFTDNAYQHSLRGFAEAGEQYVADKVAAGATDIAYVDLNKYSLDFYNRICTKEDGTVDASLIKFYFQAAKGASDCDATHPNDAGAENLAYEFFQAAKAVTDETQKAVIAGFLDNMSSETPNLVKEEVVAGGLGGTAWPPYVPPIDQEFPVVIRDIKIDDTGAVDSATVKVQQAKITMTGYGIIVITVFNEDGTEKGKIYAVDQVDNSTGYGTQVIENFRGDVTIGETDTYTAIVLPAIDSPDGLIVDDASEVVYSVEYVPTDISTYILPGEDSDVETFEYYGATNLTDNAKWVFGGSNGASFALGTDNAGVPYSTIAATGSGNSWFLMRPLENLVDDADKAVGTGNSGRYLVSADIIYNSGSGLTFALAKNTTPTKSPFVSEQFNMFYIGNGGKVSVEGTEIGAISAIDWTNVQYILDMGTGKAEVSIGGGTPVVVDIPYYQSFSTPPMDTLNHFVLVADRTAAFDIKISNLTVAKLKDSKDKTTLNVSVGEEYEGLGTVYTTEEGVTSTSVTPSSSVTATAVANDGYVFTGWLSDGVLFSEDTTVSLRLYKDMNLVATFDKQSGIDGITNYAITADKYSVKAAAGATITLALDNVIDAAGNPVIASNTDVTWSCDDANVTISADGVVTLGDAYTTDGAVTKDITITGVLNGVTKTLKITTYSYAYYEVMAEGATNYDGLFMTIGGKTAIVFPAANANQTYTMSAPVTLDTATTITYQNAWTGSNTCGQSRTLNFLNSAGATIFSVTYTWDGLTVGSNETVYGAVTKDTWSDVVIKVDPETKVVTVTVAGTTDVTTTLADDAGDLAGIQFVSAASVPGPNERALGMSNIIIAQ